MKENTDIFPTWNQGLALCRKKFKILVVLLTEEILLQLCKHIAFELVLFEFAAPSP